MSKIELTPATIQALNSILNRDSLETYIDLMEGCIDDYLVEIPDDPEEASRTLEQVAALRRLSKELSALLKTLE